MPKPSTHYLKKKYGLHALRAHLTDAAKVQFHWAIADALLGAYRVVRARVRGLDPAAHVGDREIALLIDLEGVLEDLQPRLEQLRLIGRAEVTRQQHADEKRRLTTAAAALAPTPRANTPRTTPKPSPALLGRVLDRLDTVVAPLYKDERLRAQRTGKSATSATLTFGSWAEVVALAEAARRDLRRRR